MNLTPIKSNMTELKMNDWIMLFSYRTPVVAYNKNNPGVYVTNKKWSKTTSRHINVYLKNFGPDIEVKHVEQEFLDNLVK